MNVNWKKTLVVVLDVFIGIYLVLAMTSFNKPDESANVCNDIRINVGKDVVDGFLTPDLVMGMLSSAKLSLISQPMNRINTRQIEEILQGNDLIDNAECYKTQTGLLFIDVRQRIPVVRVLTRNGEDYYVDNHGEVMQHNNYTCNLLVATGAISKSYASKVLGPLANIIVTDDFWKNQIEQLNVLDDGSVEIVPGVGDHIVYIGQPTGVTAKLERLRKFYRYGLSKAGWNKYSRISVEFDNQIICKRRKL